MRMLPISITFFCVVLYSQFGYRQTCLKNATSCLPSSLGIVSFMNTLVAPPSQFTDIYKDTEVLLVALPIDSCDLNTSGNTSSDDNVSNLLLRETNNSFCNNYESKLENVENFISKSKEIKESVSESDEGLDLSALTMSQLEIIPAGSYVIAMDNTLQGGGSFNLKTYGLIVRLLHADVPLKWAISSTKAKDGIDFSAEASRIRPTVQGNVLRDFKSGPIIVYPEFESRALPVIDAYGNNVNVYQTTLDNQIEIYSNISHKIKAAVLTAGGNGDIHTDIYDEAGLTLGAHYVEADNSSAIINANSCYTFVSEPHDDNPSAYKTDNVEIFLRSGGNFLAQCHAVESYSNQGLLANFLTKNTGGNETYSNHSEPFAQFIGLLPDEGGSVQDFQFTSNPGLAIITRPNNAFVAYVGRETGVTTNTGGYIHYLGGHEHGSVNGKRMLLNAMLTPAERPNTCNLTVGPITLDDTVEVIQCGESVIVNVLNNDFNPIEGSLTVSLVGSGVGNHGTFVLNSNNTITYTLTDDFFSGTDQVTYEACNSNNKCDQATLTITGDTNLILAGTVFIDDNENGIFESSEEGLNGVTVRVYTDTNENGQVDSGEGQITSQSTTNGGGMNLL